MGGKSRLGHIHPERKRDEEEQRHPHQGLDDRLHASPHRGGPSPPSKLASPLPSNVAPCPPISFPSSVPIRREESGTLGGNPPPGRIAGFWEHFTHFHGHSRFRPGLPGRRGRPSWPSVAQTNSSRAVARPLRSGRREVSASKIVAGSPFLGWVMWCVTPVEDSARKAEPRVPDAVRKRNHPDDTRTCSQRPPPRPLANSGGGPRNSCSAKGPRVTSVCLHARVRRLFAAFGELPRSLAKMSSWFFKYS